MNYLDTVRKYISLATIIAFATIPLFAFVPTSKAILSSAGSLPSPDVQEKQSLPKGESLSAVPDILKKVAWCESRNRQFEKDGSVFRGKINPQDVGRYQINERFHLDESRRLGYDIYTLKGNTEYAIHIFKSQGLKPWSWSKWCWDDPQREWWINNGLMESRE